MKNQSNVPSCTVFITKLKQAQERSVGAPTSYSYQNKEYTHSVEFWPSDKLVDAIYVTNKASCLS